MNPQVAPDLHQQAAGLGRLAARLRRALNRRVRAELGGTPMPEAHLDALRTVAAAPAPPRVQDVAAVLRLAPNTVSTLVAALVERDLLRRDPDPADGRVVRLSPTPRARRRMAMWHARRAGVVAAHLEALPDAERTALLAALPALEHLTESLERDG